MARPQPTNPSTAGTAGQPLPQSDRAPDVAQGHWLLARLGKRVLRPGGLALTSAMLEQAELPGSDVVEFAPGIGRTATMIIEASPRSYTGVDADSDAARLVTNAVGGAGRCLVGDAQNTGLPAACADVVVGEAMLTMQGERSKQAIIAEAVRLLRPGGRYVIHELGLSPDDIPGQTKEEIRLDLTRSIRVNARPLTIAEWSRMLGDAGLRVEWTRTEPMALLNLGRNISDEGLVRTIQIARRALTSPDIRKRVLGMRRVFARHAHSLRGVALVGRLP
ncbi:MAG: class I SAM-dependent methyltransferase [Beutenbergiaceae bacterium]